MLIIPLINVLVEKNAKLWPYEHGKVVRSFIESMELIFRPSLKDLSRNLTIVSLFFENPLDMLSAKTGKY